MKKKNNIIFLTFLLFLISTSGVLYLCSSVSNYYPLIAYFVILVFSVFIVKRRLWLYNILFGNIIFNVFLNRFYQIKYGAPYFIGGSDDAFSFEKPAREVLSRVPDLNYTEYVAQMILYSAGWRVVGYQYLVSWFMKIGDMIGIEYYTIVPVFFNTFLLTITSLILFKLSKDYLIFNIREAKLVSIIYSTFPLVVFVNSHVFRDTLFNFLVLSFIYLSYKKSLKNFVIQLIILLVTTQLRYEYSFIMLLGWLFLPFFNTYLYKIKGINAKFFVLFNFILFFVTITVVGYFKISLVNYLFEKTSVVDDYRSASGLSGIIFTLPWYLKLPAKVLFLIIMPYPSINGPFEQIFQGMGSFIQIIFTPLAFYGAFKAVKDKRIFRISYWFFIYFFMISLGSVDFKHKPSIIMLGSIVLVYGFRFFSFKGRDITASELN